MLQVFVLEDDPQKAEQVLATLESAGVVRKNITWVTTIQQAKTWLRKNRSDVLILDLNVPRRIEDAPTFHGGVELLDELSGSGRFHKPEHVIGLTQYEDAFRFSAPAFEEALIPIIMYDQDGGWRRKLANRIRYLVATRVFVPSAVGNYDFDLAIVTAMERPELEAVLRIPWGWCDLSINEDDTRYFEGAFRANNSSVRVVAASSPLVGMSAAACIATKMIVRFRPHFLVHCGITAGIRGRVDIGDVLVADPSWDWGSGKFAKKNNKVVFYAAPYQFPLREEVRAKIRRLASDEGELARIRSEWPGAKPSNAIRVALGPLASGGSVLGDAKTSAQIEEQHRKLIGIEMETYGIFAAAEYCDRPRPLSVALKSVCDFADPTKNDTHQSYAAYTSARCVQSLAEKYLFS